MTREVYAKLEADKILYSDEIQERMLRYLKNPESGHCRTMQDLMEYLVKQTSHLLPVDTRKVSRAIDDFANCVAIEILEEKYGDK